MATYTDKNGKVLARVRKGGIVKSKVLPTKTAAKAWAEAVEREIDKAGYTGKVDVKSATVADLIDKYKAEIAPHKPYGRSKESTLNLIRNRIGKVQLRNLTTKRILEYADKRIKEGAGPVALNNDMMFLGVLTKVARQVWQWDLSESAVPEAVAALRIKNQVGRSKRRDRRITPDEEKTLLEYFRGRNNSTVPMADVMLFLIDTAMRVSEVTSITWADLNRADMTVWIRNRKHPQDKFGNDMEVPLLGRSFGLAVAQPQISDRIFPYNARTISTYWARACAACGIDGLHLHDLRHEGVSRLFEAGYAIQEVQLVSGHRDVNMLMRYTQIRAKNLHRIAAQ